MAVTPEFEQLFLARELNPSPLLELLRSRGRDILLGAMAPLGCYALFHLVTIFPLSWIALQGSQTTGQVLTVQIVGGIVGIIATIGSGWIAARIGKRTTVGALAAMIGVFSLLTPLLLGGSPVMQDTFILLGFALLGISYGQASGTVTANFERRFRYTGAALTSDFAWLFGAAFAPLVALGLSAKFGLLSVTVYLLSGVICTLLALAVNQTLSDQSED